MDCFTLLDRALDDVRGIRVELKDERSAVYLRLRLHQARQITRSENRLTYPEPDHPLHGRSEYDGLTLRIDPGPPCWLYLDKVHVEVGRVEPIPEDYQIAAPRPVLLLEHKPTNGPTPQIRRR